MIVNPKGVSAEQLRTPVAERRLGSRMHAITTKYLVGGTAMTVDDVTPLGEPMRYHWVRHPVATDLLATSPEALAFVAHVLNISLEMVRRTYDRLKLSVAMRFAGRHQGAEMGGLGQTL
jgi:hypothetical protein